MVYNDAADHNEVCEVDDCDGGRNKEITGATELLSVKQRGQCKRDGSSESAVRQHKLINVVQPHQTHVVRYRCQSYHA